MVFCAKAIDDVIDTKVLDLQAEEEDNIDVMNIRDCMEIGLICGANNRLRSAYTDSTTVAETCRNTSSRFQATKEKRINNFLKVLRVITRAVLEVSFIFD